MCVILLLADPSLHLHRWWSNHEHALPEPSGPEKPRCLVSVNLVPGRSSGLPSVFGCPHGSFMGQQIADSPFFYCPSLRWDRKNNPEPWNKMEPTQQYKVRMVMHYLHKHLLLQAPHSLTFFHNSILSEVYFFEGKYTSHLLSCSKVHVALSH